MAIKMYKSNYFVVYLIICMMLMGVLIPAIGAADIKSINGFEEGPSFIPVVPLKKTTFVGFDKETLLDDYAYLAAVPTAVFKHENELYSHPLLFYENEYKYEEDEERSLNTYQGLYYFMEDWEEICGQKFDQMTLINVPKNKAIDWKAEEYIEIIEENPYEIANTLALQEWAYSNDAIIAVINERFENPNYITKGLSKGSISKYEMGHQLLKVEQPVIGTGGTYKPFEIKDENFKYVVARMSWPNRIDLDLQIYDSQLGMIDNAAESYNAPDPNLEVVGSYIHNYGKWQISVTAVPKKALYQEMAEEQEYKRMTIKELVKTLKKTGDVDVWLYPGTVVDLEPTPFGCRNAEFKLTWNDPSVSLGFTLLDPKGTEICSSLTKEEITSGKLESDEAETEIKVKMLGECREGETYSVCVFALGDVNANINFELDYKWEQTFLESEADSMVSATNGAVLASSLNAPLLYTSPSSLSDATKDVLYKLGIENIYLVNIGGHLSSDVKEAIEEIGKIKGHYTKAMQIYDAIKETTGNCDIIFTTIDSWSYWLVEGLEPAGEYPNALFVGPAAYLAAHHGSPVLIIDKHPRLSQAACYPTVFWRKTSSFRHRIVPAAGSMILSGQNVYDFLEDYNLGKLEEGDANRQDQETIITVAGQYDIGLPWDRMFTGAALPGRFWASPVDTAYAISRNMFYPVLIFANPAMYEDQAKRINGSTSKIQRIGGRLKEPRGVTLVTTKKSGEENYKYPILETFNTYLYKFNERAWKTWDFKYTRADGIIPYETPSPDAIDDGATGKPGAYYPDISETDVVPFYATKAGYGSVFSTEAFAVTENLNRGVILWVLKGHGWFMESGVISMWDSKNPYAYEENPWRVYEPVLLQPGNLREFIRWVIYAATGEKQTKFTDGFIKFHLLSEIGSTESPDVATINPQLYLLNRFAKILPIDLWGANGIMIYRDRIKRPLQSILKGLPLINFYYGDGKVIISPASGHQPMTSMTGLKFDDALENVHSCGLNTGACLPACTYIHLAWMRHGMTYQVIDPWTTSDYNGVWNQMIIKRLAMGDTIGEAYEKGMRAVGPELLVGQFWWDVWENVEFFGDPELRVFVPSTEFSDENNWEKPDLLTYDNEINLNGHMPYGATNHPHAKTPQTFVGKYLWLIGILILIVILIIAMIAIGRKKK